jgi:carboxyl-terminal processing protease
LPRLTELFHERSGKNPDFVYLEEQIALATETRNIEELPLKESERIALRENQEARALDIENKRRRAKGEEPLEALEDEDEDNADGDEAGSDALAGDLSDEDDVLLTEAGNILVDALLIKERRFAVHAPEAE